MQNLPDELCVSVFRFLETPQHLAKMLVCSREARALCDETARTLLMIRQTPHFLVPNGATTVEIRGLDSNQAWVAPHLLGPWRRVDVHWAGTIGAAVSSRHRRNKVISRTDEQVVCCDGLRVVRFSNEQLRPLEALTVERRSLEVVRNATRHRLNIDAIVTALVDDVLGRLSATE